MSAYIRLLDALRQRGSTVKANGTKATAQCPAHEDRGPSLSVADVEGRVLIHCFTGCEPAAVMDALSLPLSALYDETGDAWTPTRRNWVPRPAPNPLGDAEHWCDRALQQTRLDADPAWQARRADELAAATAARPGDFEGRP